eukprot:CAMPEP_0172616730 /NCGR_PEP_ID=MMETSP1068-20121228/67034_1 /TAXON_ID=35684 /ORGANISM="Pseudopedinella elastica, Strain CCMP716" /LENGTH=125 /DNA_ID=CAMNT_0013422257 /DNA_START=268 /DNA_END=645 /DNA_ORIENTATION=+
MGDSFFLVTPTLDSLKVLRAFTERRQLPGRRARVEEGPVVIDQDEGLEARGAPHELECDAGSELKVGHVLGRLLVAAHDAGAPTPARPEVLQARKRDPWPKQVRTRDALNATLVLVPRHAPSHAG